MNEAQLVLRGIHAQSKNIGDFITTCLNVTGKVREYLNAGIAKYRSEGDYASDDAELMYFSRTYDHPELI